jgi:hypothetical protein
VRDGENDARKRGGRWLPLKRAPPRLSLAHLVVVRQQYIITTGTQAWCTKDNLSGPRVVASRAWALL